MKKKKTKTAISEIHPEPEQVVVVYDDGSEKAFPKPEWFDWYSVHRYNDGFIDGKDEVRGKIKDILGL
jgi:hypothetical protein